MLIYGGQLTAKPGHGGQLGAVLHEMRALLSDATGEPWWAWAGIGGGQPFGTFMLSSRASGLAQLMAMRQAAFEHDDFGELSGRLGEVMAMPMTEYYTDVLHVTGEPADAPLAMTQVTTASLAGGHWAAGGAWAVEVAEHVTAVTGTSVMVGTSALGAMGTVSWLAGAPDAAEIDESNAALRADERYMQMLDEAGDHFISGSATRGVLAQLP